MLMTADDHDGSADDDTTMQPLCETDGYARVRLKPSPKSAHDDLLHKAFGTRRSVARLFLQPLDKTRRVRSVIQEAAPAPAPAPAPAIVMMVMVMVVVVAVGGGSSK